MGPGPGRRPNDRRSSPGQKVTLLTGVKPWGSWGECSTTRCALPDGSTLRRRGGWPGDAPASRRQPQGRGQAWQPGGAPVLVHGAPVLVGVYAEGKAVRGLKAAQAAAVGDQRGWLLRRDGEQGRVRQHARREGRVLCRHRQAHARGVSRRPGPREVHLHGQELLARPPSPAMCSTPGPAQPFGLPGCRGLSGQHGRRASCRAGEHLQHQRVRRGSRSHLEAHAGRQLHGRRVLAPAVQDLLALGGAHAVPLALPHGLVAAGRTPCGAPAGWRQAGRSSAALRALCGERGAHRTAACGEPGTPLTGA